jgi:hypothetical protein
MVEWPEGEKMRVTNRLSLSSFKLRINQQRDWFAASGELQISDDEVLDMQKLMELLDASPGRFVKLQEGSFSPSPRNFANGWTTCGPFPRKMARCCGSIPWPPWRWKTGWTRWVNSKPTSTGKTTSSAERSPVSEARGALDPAGRTAGLSGRRL